MELPGIPENFRAIIYCNIHQGLSQEDCISQLTLMKHHLNLLTKVFGKDKSFSTIPKRAFIPQLDDKFIDFDSSIDRSN